MKLAFIFLVGFLLGACAAPSRVYSVEHPASHVGQAVTLAEKTVALVVPDPDSGDQRAYCAGVWVSENAILTAQHCVADLGLGERVEYIAYADKTVPPKNGSPIARIGVLSAFDAGHDLALVLDTKAPQHVTAVLSNEVLLPGTFVQTMGHPLGLWWSYSSGDIAAIRQVDIGLDILWIQSTAPISPGNSGGGLFDEYGNLMGICSRGASSPRAQNLNFYVHRNYLLAFLLASQGVK